MLLKVFIPCRYLCITYRERAGYISDCIRRALLYAQYTAPVMTADLRRNEYNDSLLQELYANQPAIGY